MSEPLIDSTVIAQIQSIIKNGNRAEIEYGRDGVKVVEVRRKVLYATKKEAR